MNMLRPLARTAHLAHCCTFASSRLRLCGVLHKRSRAVLRTLCARFARCVFLRSFAGISTAHARGTGRSTLFELIHLRPQTTFTHLFSWCFLCLHSMSCFCLRFCTQFRWYSRMNSDELFALARLVFFLCVSGRVNTQYGLNSRSRLAPRGLDIALSRSVCLSRGLFMVFIVALFLHGKPNNNKIGQTRFQQQTEQT